MNNNSKHLGNNPGKQSLETSTKQIESLYSQLLDMFQNYQKLTNDFEERLKELETLYENNGELVQANDELLAFENSNESSLVSLSSELKEIHPKLIDTLKGMKEIYESGYKEILETQTRCAILKSLEDTGFKDFCTKMPDMLQNAQRISKIVTFALVAEDIALLLFCIIQNL